MSEPRALQGGVLVPASVAEVWRAWTTVEGIRSFFAPDARIEVRPGGAWEILFLTDAPVGSQGSEGCRVLEVQAPRRLAFSWNFPPHMPAIRDQHTRVEIGLEPTASGATWLEFLQTGWGEGADWDAGYEYFDRAWDLVLARLQRRFAVGPLDWSKPWGAEEEPG
jgi:uncharacterized protein YndB with AHSA1/START domain